MDNYQLCLLAAGALALLNIVMVMQPKKWRSTCIYLHNRQELGRFNKDFSELRANPQKFYENFHMDLKTFDALFAQVGQYLEPKKKYPHKEISPIEKFAAVLEYLASGSLQRHVASMYRISKQHFGVILDEVCKPITIALKDKIPGLSKEALANAAVDLEGKWNFSNCVGAIDGRHVPIRCPPNAGSLFYNYKGFHSIVLLAIADANYKFMHVDIGAFGSEGDASVFANSSTGMSIYGETLQFPEDRPLGGKWLPYVFVADDAFSLHRRILKPYVPKRGQYLTEEQTVFNYRLSCARRCVENAFGILCARWYCLGRTMICFPDRAQKITLACCYLHNYLMCENRGAIVR